MARIILSGYMIRYPLGGMVCNTLQWLYGLHQLGHDVYFVEKANYPDACFDPSTEAVGNDGSYGFTAVSCLLATLGLEGRICFVDYSNTYYGLSDGQVKALFDGADLYIDYGNHGAWLCEAGRAHRRVLVDGEPGYRQMHLTNTVGEEHAQMSNYDYYYTVGRNVGTGNSPVPTAGISWRHLFHPVVLSLFGGNIVFRATRYTTVMNWQSHPPVEYCGVAYGQKDIEFDKFITLPRLTTASLEVAVAGQNVPVARLLSAGWYVRRALDVTLSYESFLRYIRTSRGEFNVCKNVFVATNSGWFSDRSAAYLASGRPVVLQDTGYSSHLPTGSGLFAVADPHQAAAAIEAIEQNYERHARSAREIAGEYLSATRVLGRFLEEVCA